MQKHTKVYYKYFGYDIASYVPCEICGNEAVDLHHIDARGMGGNPKGDKEVIENYMALCRLDHDKYGDKAQYKDYLKEIHLNLTKNKC